MTTRHAFTLAALCALLFALTPATPAAAQDPMGSLMTINDMVAGVAQRLDVRFICEPGLLGGNQGLYVADGSSAASKDRSIPQFDKDADCWHWFGAMMFACGYGWIGMDAEQRLYRIMRLDMLGRQAHLSVTDPADIPADVMWATISINLRYIDAASVQRALLNLVTRTGGVVQPVVGGGCNSILISDYAGQLQQLHDAAKALDVQPRKAVRVVTVEHPKVMNAAMAVSHLVRLFAEEVKNGRVAFSDDTQPDGSNSRVLVRVETQLEDEVMDAIRTILGANKSEDGDGD